MIVTSSRIRQIGWVVALTICAALFVALTFRVNAVKSEVRLAERRIIALEREKQILSTEFETRANQRQLANWNKVEFGYSAPKAEQYLENERQLAQLGLARDANAPTPIRVALAVGLDGGGQSGGERGGQSGLDGGPDGEFEGGVVGGFISAMAMPLRTKNTGEENSVKGQNANSARGSLAQRLSSGSTLGGPIAGVGAGVGVGVGVGVGE